MFTIVLTSAPTSDVSVSLTSSDLTEGTVFPASVTFTTMNWSTPQTVTVTGVDDFVADGSTAYSITTGNATSADPTYNGLGVADVSVTNTDDDVIGVTVSPTSGLVTTELGGTATFTIVLTSQPTSDVSISLMSSNLTEGTVAPASVTFTTMNWSTPQTVTVTGVGDGVFDLNGIYTIVTGAAVSVDVGYSGLAVSDVSVSNSQPPTAYIKASNSGSGDSLGHSIALSSDGTTLAVGAYGEASAAVGVGGNQADNSTASAGAVYIFTRAGSVWTQQAYIKASNTGAGDRFGWAIALSSDGSTLVVGARYERSNATGIGGNQSDNSAAQAGAVYVFSRAGSAWTQEAYVKASNAGAADQFGYSVALSPDGTTLAVGAYGEASAALGVGGNQGDNSVSYAGAVYIFRRAGAVWSQEAYIKASNTGGNDQFGWSVALSSDGATLAVGAWLEKSAATGIDGNGADNSANSAGAVYVFTRAAVMWTQEAYVKASNAGAGDVFGWSVALSSDGNTLAVGAYGEGSSDVGIGGNQADNSAPSAGAVYVFTRAGGTWGQQAYIKASNTEGVDLFGGSVRLSSDGNTMAVGGYGEGSSAVGISGNQADNSASPNAGAVYVFTRMGAAWSQEAYIKASNTDAGDVFGNPVALSSDGNMLAVGAGGEDSSATGIGGNQADNSASNAGAAYVYTAD
ncbi:MAG: integrin [Sandaracinaceae bacterium]|nr:integrin [Sandaracinaceae bacterium]